MKVILFSLTAVLCLTGVSCTPTQKSAGTGAAAGAILGTIIADGDDHKKGALIGAAAGGAAGAAIGRNREKKRDYYY
ncbi:MAG: YMGG-like glycine zipper-containing protein [Verrucomicrobiales bacterium]|nr:YMGG-like glycine zipper-containing protein [Verrucomicrobiales bacterium]